VKKIVAVLLLMCVCGMAQQPAPGAGAKPTAPANVAPPFELENFYMAIMKPAPAYDESKAAALMARDRDYWQASANRSELALGGPAASPNIKCVFLYRAASLDKAVLAAQNDPLVQEKQWLPEVHGWMTMKGVLKPLHNYEPDTKYYLGFLVAGPKFSPEDSPERQKIQEGHMANIKRLGDLGKLVVAGPFAEDSKLRGIFVFRVTTMQEALELTNTDPAVQSGRLAIQLYEWKLPSEAFAKQ